MAKKSRKTAKTNTGLRIISATATANLQPPGPFSLTVDARVEVPTPGYTATLKKALQGINPTILILEVVAKAKPGTWPDHIAQVNAEYKDKNYKNKFKQVTIRYGKQSKTVDVHIIV